MTTTSLVVILSLVTLLAVLVMALRSKAAVDALRRDPHSPPSSLSKSSPGASAVERLDR